MQDKISWNIPFLLIFRAKCSILKVLTNNTDFKEIPMTKDIHSSDNGSSSSTTAQLMKMLKSSPGQFLKVHLPSVKNAVFHKYMNQLMAERGFSVPDLIAGACISKPYTYQIITGERLPGRDIILRIGLSMNLDLDEIQRLLTLAGKSVLYPRIRRDAAVLYCVRKKLTLDETNFFLEDLGEEPLL